MDSVKNIKDVEITHLNLNDNTGKASDIKNCQFFLCSIIQRPALALMDSRYLLNN
jgi:hypothetical protein